MSMAGYPNQGAKVAVSLMVCTARCTVQLFKFGKLKLWFEVLEEAGNAG